ncbi:hypothetical protein SHJG_1032 [Streptomyces hygroscopicus subsp. jinggangensis 5008]|nr:hypothetical protein SHJG_1032 [Streptomyces hygroscopicus subsp. jinggangensis 5008]AGF60531.1 hypothetical protein SHJGH_0865 [Streptomyces hygroscopicus subsp. jinggangensis TL01]
MKLPGEWYVIHQQNRGCRDGGTAPVAYGGRGAGMARSAACT